MRCRVRVLISDHLTSSLETIRFVFSKMGKAHFPFQFFFFAFLCFFVFFCVFVFSYFSFFLFRYFLCKWERKPRDGVTENEDKSRQIRSSLIDSESQCPTRWEIISTPLLPSTALSRAT